MRSNAQTVQAYLESAPEQWRAMLGRLRSTVLGSIPRGFEERMSYGMIGYVVPHSRYPAGYHADPKAPLPFINIAAQKNYLALYHMGLYSNKPLLSWFNERYAALVGKAADMGKGCIRFKREADLPYELIGELVSKVGVDEWIGLYEKNRVGA